MFSAGLPSTTSRSKVWPKSGFVLGIWDFLGAQSLPLQTFLSGSDALAVSHLGLEAQVVVSNAIPHAQTQSLDHRQ